MEMNKYEKGEKICEELFYKTGDPIYYTMKNGFSDLKKQKQMEENKNQLGM